MGGYHYGSGDYAPFAYGGSSGSYGGGYVVPQHEHYHPTTPHQQPMDTEEAPQPGAGVEPTSLFLPTAFEQKARLTLNVPSDAVVTLNGSPMSTTGTERKFISPVLAGDGPYYYHIQVEVVRNGEKMTAESQQLVKQGRSYAVTFAEKEGSLVLVSPAFSAEVASK